FYNGTSCESGYSPFAFRYNGTGARPFILSLGGGARRNLSFGSSRSWNIIPASAAISEADSD
ncbi:MAG TPA: hypothetical protein VE732_08475, partial [Nitrososphaera sp.]|nr:hypothetical protein [Nitrososphaera sp.]